MARSAGSTQPPDPPPKDADGESEQRLLRVAGDRGLSLTERLSARVANSLYRTPLHRIRLRGRYPLKLLGVPHDPIPGDCVVGERLVAGRLLHAGQTVMTRDINFADPALAPAWRDWANGWHWLRDLAVVAADPKSGARTAEPLIARWLAQFGRFDATGWRADITGARLLFGFAYAPLILSSADQIYRSLLLSAMATWARHLDRAAFRLPDGLPRVWALGGLYAAGVLIPGGEARAAAALTDLDRLAGVLVLPDGGIETRAPGDAVMLTELLLLLAAVPAAVGVRPSPLFADTLKRLVPALRGLALGDGVIGGWHGSAAIDGGVLELLAKRAATGTAITRSGGWSGYRRLSAGKTVVVIDAGPPPLARVSSIGHAGTLAFEMSDGADRLITNCGGGARLTAPLPAGLAEGLRTTAAHSTLTIADTNSTRIRAGSEKAGANFGALGLGVEEVVVQTRQSEEGQWIEASHDGYAKRFGALVRRRLFLSPDGRDLRGEDIIEPLPKSHLKRRPDRSFDVRFHLGPGVAATPTADGAGALLKLPKGRVWGMKARGGHVSIEPSLWVDPGGTVHKTQQLVISGRTEKAAASIGWSFKCAAK